MKMVQYLNQNGYDDIDMGVVSPLKGAWAFIVSEASLTDVVSNGRKRRQLQGTQHAS